MSSSLLRASVSAINDWETYVRAIALEIIASSTGADILWQHINSEIDVTRRCYTLLNDTEALVRRPTVKALTAIARAGYLSYVLTHDVFLFYVL